MKTVITEDQLSATEVFRYDDVLAVKSADDVSGVQLYRARSVAEFTSSTAPSKVREESVLLIVVDDPDDFEAIERLKEKVSAAWLAR